MLTQSFFPCPCMWTVRLHIYWRFYKTWKYFARLIIYA